MRSYDNINDMYRGMLQQLLVYGQSASPRGEKTLEIIAWGATLDNPDSNILVSPVRNLNYSFQLAEWLWILCGFNDTEMLVPYNTKIEVYSDDGMFFRGAYGPKFVDQLPYILAELRRDSQSRRALMTFWRERPERSLDIPCTISLQFLIREGRLDLVTFMRSNDAWLGFPYDVFTFTMIQKYVAAILELPVGRYHHLVGSLHLYEQHTGSAYHVVNEDVRWLAETPKLTYMPASFKAMYTGLTLMSRHEEAADDMKHWLNSARHSIPEPWGNFLDVLAYRFHRDKSLLPHPWTKLIGKETV